MSRRRLCQVPVCDAAHHARGMCKRHYAVWRRGSRAPLLLPGPRFAPEPPPPRSRCSTGADVAPPFGWAHLPLVTDADGIIRPGRPAARLDWGRRIGRHTLGVLRDPTLPWWELGLRVPWAAACQEGT